MLSYQHSYHAGCLADVHKHAALAVLLTKLTEKDKPLTYMETHAGRGLYDLTAPESLKTGEAAAGIQALEAAGRIPPDHPFARLLLALRQEQGANAYPGSPKVAQMSLRDHDPIHLMELHPQEHAALKRNLRAPNIHIHRRDGYEGVLALSPPKPRRGLVLIDPSFEVKAEYGQAAEFIPSLHRKWPEAVIALWYPLLAAGHHGDMMRRLDAARLPKVWKTEVIFHDPTEARGMYGTGFYVVNCPFGCETGLDSLLTIFTTRTEADGCQDKP